MLSASQETLEARWRASQLEMERREWQLVTTRLAYQHAVVEGEDKE